MDYKIKEAIETQRHFNISERKVQELCQTAIDYAEYVSAEEGVVLFQNKVITAEKLAALSLVDESNKRIAQESALFRGLSILAPAEKKEFSTKVRAETESAARRWFTGNYPSSKIESVKKAGIGVYEVAFS